MKKSLILMSFLGLSFNFLLQAEQNPEEFIPQNLSVASNGKFLHRSSGEENRPNSANGRFWCHYKIAAVTDEIRQLQNFQLFEDGRLCFQKAEIPGSDFYISNSGIVASLDTRQHFRNRLTIDFYSKQGKLLFSHTLKGASLFGFSSSGKLFGAGNAKELLLISPENAQVTRLPGGFQFAISEDDQFVAIAGSNDLRVYSQGQLVQKFQTGFDYPRGLALSARENLVAVIGKHQLKAFSSATGELLFCANLPARYSFRDLEIVQDKILTGVHFKDTNLSTGLLRIYDRTGSFLFEKTEASQTIPVHPKSGKKKTLNREIIPWPFYPFDQTPTIWNYYEQHMGGYGIEFSYLHQGLDIITPVGEHTFAVADGIVKCVLTLGGAIYWRIAVSAEQNSGYSNGWLYAHLIESSIQYEVGDTVRVHDYLGDIIQWHDDWGHIHFVEIADSGLVWQYDDNEWGINFNPLLALDPVTDTDFPIIEAVFPGQKFAFCVNETSDYLEPDSLFGEFDIIAKIADYVGDSDWQQPAYETFYWVQSENDSIIFPRTLGQRLNHAFSFYNSESYEPFATLLYKRDFRLLPTSWMNKNRNFYHILTNNNGDSLALLEEKELAFNSANFYDGNYWIFVEARDVSGNSTIDSMQVEFKNKIVSQVENFTPEIHPNASLRIFPNPFNATTQIEYFLPQSVTIQLQIFDVLGREIFNLSENQKPAGTHRVQFDGTNLASGVYWVQLQSHREILVKKMALLR